MSLIIQNLSVSLNSKEILKDISLTVKPGEIHALMGPNGSGKSTLAGSLMGNESYQVQSGKCKVQIDGKDILRLKTEERAREGLFLAFQNPIAIPGVTVANLIRTAVNLTGSENKEITTAKNNPALSMWDFNKKILETAKHFHIPQEFLTRSLNEEFSGGEKKKLEMLQAVMLKPKFAIFDEIDTGLDVDALQIVAEGISELKKNGSGIIIITHYNRILKYAIPNYVHILVDGSIVETGDKRLALEIEKNGYKKWVKSVNVKT